MPAVTRHASGRFCWAELATTDQEGQRHFIQSSLLDGERFPIGENRFYSMLISTRSVARTGSLRIRSASASTYSAIRRWTRR